MQGAVLDFLSARGGTDLYISAAAISDFAPERVHGKIKSGRPATLKLEPLPKLLSSVLEQYHPATLGFKLDRSPEPGANKMLKEGVRWVLMNEPDTMGSTHGEYVLLEREGHIPMKGTKEDIAAQVFHEIIRDISSTGFEQQPDKE
jgi:phosphopantothenoylcysteine decarboxylase / phosphopantothenate---cysteine ligase